MKRLLGWTSLFLLIATSAPALAFEGEELAFPIDDAVVPPAFKFFIQADGVPNKDHFYKIEIAQDSEFETIVETHDSREKKTGWRYTADMGISVPKRFASEFSSAIGISLRVTRSNLPDGEYYWRAFKAQGAGAWVEIGDVESFYLDSVPPDTVEDLRMRVSPTGSIVMEWLPPNGDIEGEAEVISGYRVYRYTKLLKRYPTLTKYLVAETENTKAEVALDDERNVVFYRVQAVDAVGNEEGRRRPAPLGMFEAQFNPPNLDQLTDPEYLRQRNAEYYAEDDE